MKKEELQIKKCECTTCLRGVNIRDSWAQEYSVVMLKDTSGAFSVYLCVYVCQSVRERALQGIFPFCRTVSVHKCVLSCACVCAVILTSSCHQQNVLRGVSWKWSQRKERGEEGWCVEVVISPRGDVVTP